MIRLKSGVYGAENGVKRPKDGPFSLTDNEEARLVRRGVAEYVFDRPTMPAPPAQAEDTTPIHYDVGMTMKQLQGIAAYFGLNASKLRSKQAVVNLLDAHLAGGANEEEPEEESGEEDEGEDEDEGGGDADHDAPDLGAAEPTA